MQSLPTSPLKSSSSLTSLTSTLWFVREGSAATCCELDRGGSTPEVVQGLVANFHLWLKYILFLGDPQLPHLVFRSSLPNTTEPSMFGESYQIFSMGKHHWVEVCLAACVVAQSKNWLVGVAKPDLKHGLWMELCGLRLSTNWSEELIRCHGQDHLVDVFLLNITWSMASLRRTSTFFSR